MYMCVQYTAYTLHHTIRMLSLRFTYSNAYFSIFFFSPSLSFSLSSGDESETHRRSKLKRSTGLPPVTPNACVKDTVRSLLFDQIWSEVITILQPLLIRMRQNASQGENDMASDQAGWLSHLCDNLCLHITSKHKVDSNNF